ncbi:MAG: DUF262 domain-containing protein [Chloroflexi bacterium]|nr:DUF262 domain-containing protein [Chloroflexota bacterium]
MTNEELGKDKDIENEDKWFEDYASSEESDFQIQEYDLTASPNDFNIMTIFSFIESGAIKIPGFQRNFVWDINRSSKLIESLIMGLPVPQLFLYEEGRNRFLVIDGQQRLMSVYYFIKQRFPRKGKSVHLRHVFDIEGKIPDEILQDDEYFTPFKLHLPERLPRRRNKFQGLVYATLGEYKSQFDLRPIRMVIVKQNAPEGDDSAVFEIFNRLNTGGMNLRPQEIRTSLYHSEFYEMVNNVNTLGEWRRFLGRPDPDVHMKDVEILLRGFAMLIEGDKYNPSMVKFLNVFSEHAKGFDPPRLQYLQSLLESYLQSCSELPLDAFQGPSRRFSPMTFESVFVAVCRKPYSTNGLVSGKIDPASVDSLKADKAFSDASQSNTTSTTNVKTRLSRARELIVLK